MAYYQKNHSDRAEVVNIYWFDVDPRTQDSVVVYKDRAAYEAALEDAQKTRNLSYERGMKMLHEVHGESFVTLRD